MLRLTSLLLGVALLLTGGGLLGTLLAVRGGQEGFSANALGWVMSGYFAGFFVGTFTAPPLIRRMGHSRAFAFHAALATMAVLLHPLWLDPWGWGLLRVVTGIALVGLYTVIESWLNAEPDPQRRSRVFSLYMMINLSALALGQVLLMLGDAGAAAMFTVTALLVCAAMLPVTATRLQQPDVPNVPRLKLGNLYSLAPVATVAAGLSGLAMGPFWGLLPVFAGDIGLSGDGVPLFMLAAIAGGALLQWPLGRISDGHDRRIGLMAVSLAAAGLAVLAAMPLIQQQLHVMFLLVFCYGGLVFALYPFAVAHMLDYLASEDLLSGCSSLLLVHGVGAAVGPAIAGALMSRFGAPALPLYFAAVLICLAAFTGMRLLSHARLRTHPAPFRAMLRTTPSALELMPETETPLHPEKETH
ncbi:MFS transporter [Stenotrophomonas chelatiphaga]|uniref:MFS transporter n=1 Tax=Stenotrophomonas chelatiphaga TaxID=517011 RepID=A0A0R0DHQ4_9GAMM|nr:MULTISPECIES: MFS transporter [Stenotrophomonas]KRG77027.1 MFS transporter [Stenotrophomonas chelatiphaga]MCS4231469.1 MFS family permease [Stenotrophomonas chelatiphaga]MDR6095420.1 MFS family permease [Stenotrophomonas sp. SORGH_AS_0321]ROQ37764.1 putative MFS family arabinose efflux permease [Stenotrophomonas maltophilia]